MAKAWTIDDALPTRTIYRCWNGLCVMRADDGTTRNQARHFASAEGYECQSPSSYVRAVRCWFNEWRVYGDGLCEDCECGAEQDTPRRGCSAFVVIAKPRAPKGDGWTPGWAFPDA